MIGRREWLASMALIKGRLVPGFLPRKAPVAPEFSNQQAEFEVDAFGLPGNRVLVGVWIPGKATGDSPSIATHIRFPGLKWKRAIGIDVLNGVEQPLQASGNRLRGMLIKDCPTFIQLELG
jgi:hypothetical protein